MRNKSILVTGYVGSPAGLPHCDEAGHQMKKVVHEDGHVTQHCTRTVHAEQNAICQAARYGIALEGATLYCRMTLQDLRDDGSSTAGSGGSSRKGGITRRRSRREMFGWSESSFRTISGNPDYENQ